MPVIVCGQVARKLVVNPVVEGCRCANVLRNVRFDFVEIGGQYSSHRVANDHIFWEGFIGEHAGNSVRVSRVQGEDALAILVVDNCSRLVVFSAVDAIEHGEVISAAVLRNAAVEILYIRTVGDVDKLLIHRGFQIYAGLAFFIEGVLNALARLVFVGGGGYDRLG